MSEPKTFDHLLLGVGAMKAGTTWIFDALHRHPDVHFCREKEIHYLYAQHVNPGILSTKNRMKRAKAYLEQDAEISALPILQKRVQWTANWLDSPIDDAWFNALFQQNEGAKYVADFSNMAALVPEEGWQALYNRTRQLRVLFTLRDPLDRLWSHLRFHLKMHGETEILDRWTMDDMEHHIRHENHYLPYCDYVGTVTRLRNTLPPECVRINMFDQIAKAPESLYRGIEDFLGIDHVDLPDWLATHVVNPSPPRPMPNEFRARFADIEAQQIEGLKALGVAIPDTWGRADA